MAPSTNTLFTSSLYHLISSCSIKLKPTKKTVASEKGAEDINIVDDWEEKDVLLRSWISGTLTEESMYLIVGYSTVKEMCEWLEETYV